MNNKLLSISIAAYNVSAYIEQCLDSLVACKNLDKLDIIVVDDGSKDNTVELVQAYVAKYPESIRLEAKENGGHGSTINRSLSVATGKYFRILDGDDWVNSAELDKLLEYLETTDLDLILTNYVRQYLDKTERVSHEKTFAIEKVYDLDMLNGVGNFSFVFMHSMTVKLDTYKAHCLPISEHCFYVDTEFLYFVLTSIHNLIYLPLDIYQYRLGREGQSVSPEGLYKHIEDHNKVVEHIISLYMDNQESLANRKGILLPFIDSLYINAFVRFSKLHKSDKDYLLEKLDKTLLSKYPYFRSYPLGKYKVVRAHYIYGLRLLRGLRKLIGKGL